MSKTIVNYGVDRPLDFEVDNEKPARLKRTSPGGVETFLQTKSYVVANCCDTDCHCRGNVKSEPCWGQVKYYEGKHLHLCGGHADYNHEYTDDKDETEMSNWGGKYTAEPEMKKLNKRGSDQSWFKSKPVSIQQTTDSIPVKID